MKKRLGLAQGKAEGKAEELTEGKLEVARTMLAEGIPMEQFQRLTEI